MLDLLELAHPIALMRGVLICMSLDKGIDY